MLIYKQPLFGLLTNIKNAIPAVSLTLLQSMTSEKKADLITIEIRRASTLLNTPIYRVRGSFYIKTEKGKEIGLPERVLETFIVWVGQKIGILNNELNERSFQIMCSRKIKDEFVIHELKK